MGIERLAYTDESIVIAINQGLAVAKGEIAGGYTVNKFGENEDADIAGMPEDIVSTGFIWDTFSSGAQTVSIVSGSGNDDKDSGSGARSIFIEGLDTNDLKISETILLEGATPVVSNKLYKLLYRAIIPTAGATGWNEGIITITGSTDTGQTMVKMAIGNNQTQMCVFAVEAEKSAYITAIRLGILRETASAVVEVDLLKKNVGGIWQLKGDYSIINSIPMSVIYFNPPMKMDALSLFKLQIASCSKDDTIISGAMDIIVLPN